MLGSKPAIEVLSRWTPAVTESSKKQGLFRGKKKRCRREPVREDKGQGIGLRGGSKGRAREYGGLPKVKAIQRPGQKGRGVRKGEAGVGREGGVGPLWKRLQQHRGQSKLDKGTQALDVGKIQRG